MEQLKSTLLPHLLNYMKKYKGPDSVSTNQLILRFYKESYLTDGFFFIESTLCPHPRHTFIRVLSFRLNFDLDNVVMQVFSFEVIGIDIMPDHQIRPIRLEVQVKALIISCFRVQLRSSITETSMNDILLVTSLLPSS